VLVQIRPPRVGLAVVIAGVALILVGLAITVRVQPDERLAMAPLPMMLSPPDNAPKPPARIGPANVEAGQAGAAETPEAPPEAPAPPEPTEPEAATEEELAPLPRQQLAGVLTEKTPALAAAKHPKSKFQVSGVEQCSFDAPFIDYARRQRDRLLQSAGASKPTVREAEALIDTGLASADCRQVRAGLARLWAMTQMSHAE
jgi:hypothetical protein